jgi:hypothetical protein
LDSKGNDIQVAGELSDEVETVVHWADETVHAASVVGANQLRQLALTSKNAVIGYSRVLDELQFIKHRCYIVWIVDAVSIKAYAR